VAEEGAGAAKLGRARGTARLSGGSARDLRLVLGSRGREEHVVERTLAETKRD
jgi:hypothetical protein